MSYCVFFAFSSGLSKPLYAKVGTKESIVRHVAEIESTLSLTTEQYMRNPPHWKRNDFVDIDDKVLCDTVEKHNNWVRCLYRQMGEDWAREPADDLEVITPEDAAGFWHALTILEVPVQRWAEGYYRSRMECLYEVMRGRPTDGITWDVAKLTERQAAAVIELFSEFLDPGDLRLDVPHGYDYLASSNDGGYDWCDGCGRAIHCDDNSCRRRKCPLQAERQGDE